MKITTVEGWVKLIPSEFEDVAGSFTFTSKAVRLSGEERNGLGKAKCKKLAKERFAHDNSS